MQRVNYSLSQRAPEYRLQTPRANHRAGNHPGFTPNSSLTPTSDTPKNSASDRNYQLSLSLLLRCVSVCWCCRTSHTHVEARVSPRNKARARSRPTFDSKRRPWIRSEAKICRRRHFHTNRPYCVSSEKNTHRQSEIF